MEYAANRLQGNLVQTIATIRPVSHIRNNSLFNTNAMVIRRSNPQLIGWLAPTAHPAHGGTDERPAS
jgi:hypothetical protein